MTEMDAGEILAGLQEHIAPGSTIFICTNERDISFFRPIQRVYDVCFLGDFGKMLSDISEFQDFAIISLSMRSFVAISFFPI